MRMTVLLSLAMCFGACSKEKRLMPPEIYTAMDAVDAAVASKDLNASCSALSALERVFMPWATNYDGPLAIMMANEMPQEMTTMTTGCGTRTDKMGWMDLEQTWARFARRIRKATIK